MTKQKPESSSIILKRIFLALILDILAFTVILPLYPRILQQYHTLHASDPVSKVYSSLIHRPPYMLAFFFKYTFSKT